MAEDSSTRDRLALTRTVLANERTFLAYVRTALGFGVAGASVVHFLHGAPLHVAGWIPIILGIVTLVVGWIRYVTFRRELSEQQARKPDVR